ncbi:MAG TPA: 2-oxoacid:ferredoxin oxidoreductase subunit beta [Elusimicrobia bacterium]|nr:2-oxoacid:ferredoxin oxidoreductase subunit beta [Elusimicrobiota bacterium]
MTDKNAPVEKKPLTRQDFVSNQSVRWCPGCGDYAILAVVQKTLAAVGIPREKTVIVSGIGCSSRFPYYVNSYGFHTIHGRAPAVATGVKLANPDLQVWVVTGDGDGLAIGGNHMHHILRRNPNIKILLFNNRIYGLTKGQYSPTSEKGKITKSSPAGTIERPVNALRFALAAEAPFVARAVDTDIVTMGNVLERAARHKGVSFVELYQNCVVFNDGAFEEVEDSATRDDFTLKLEQGKPLIFGKAKDRGIRLREGRPEVVTFKPGEPPKDILVHDEQALPSYQYMLTQLEPPDFPAPVGVFRAVSEATLEDLMESQFKAAMKPGADDLYKLMCGRDTWEIQ